MVVFGNAWDPAVSGCLPDTEFRCSLEIKVPFTPMVVIGLGAIAYLCWKSV